MNNISQKSKEVWAFVEASRKESHPQSLGVTRKRSWVLSQDMEEQEILCGYPFLRTQKSVGIAFQENQAYVKFNTVIYCLNK